MECVKVELNDFNLNRGCGENPKSSFPSHPEQHPPASVQVIAKYNPNDTVTSGTDSDYDTSDSETTADINNFTNILKNTHVPHDATVIIKQAPIVQDIAIPSQVVSAPATNIDRINVEDSTDVQFGNKIYYTGPVILKEYIAIGHGGLNQDRERNNESVQGNCIAKTAQQIECNRKRKCLSMIIGLIVVTMIVASYYLFNMTNTTADNDLMEFTSTVSNENATTTTTEAGNTNITEGVISRETWKAEPPTAVLNDLKEFPANEVIISHTDSSTCDSLSACSQQIRNIQTNHFSKSFSDIGYNFLVGGDGRAYEGRGWTKEGAHTKGQNSISIGISFIGNFQINTPPLQQFDALAKLLEDGVKLKYLKETYLLYPHMYFLNTVSPGVEVLNEIKNWPHFYNNNTIVKTI